MSYTKKRLNFSNKGLELFSGVQLIDAMALSLKLKISGKRFILINVGLQKFIQINTTINSLKYKVNLIRLVNISTE